METINNIEVDWTQESLYSFFINKIEEGLLPDLKPKWYQHLIYFLVGYNNLAAGEPCEIGDDLKDIANFINQSECMSIDTIGKKELLFKEKDLITKDGTLCVYVNGRVEELFCRLASNGRGINDGWCLDGDWYETEEEANERAVAAGYSSFAAAYTDDGDWYWTGLNVCDEFMEGTRVFYLRDGRKVVVE